MARDRRESREQAKDARRRAAEAARREGWERRADEVAGPDGETDDVVRFGDGERLRAAPAPTTLGSLLDDVVARRGWGDRIRGASLADRWEEVVGEQLAARSRPGRLVGTTLEVRVADPRWSHQLRYLGPQLAGRVSAVLGRPVEDIRVVVGPIDAGSSGRG